MRFFRREIEVTLKILGVLTLIALILLPIAWGYQQRREARTWQNLACAYRIKEVTRSLRFVSHIERGRDACALLDRLGLSHSTGDLRAEPDLIVLPTRATSLPARPRAVTR